MNDWNAVMKRVDEIRQLKDSEFILRGKKRRLVIDRFEITRNGVFWVFWYGDKQLCISNGKQTIYEDRLVTQDDGLTYFEILKKSVEDYDKLCEYVKTLE